MRPHVPAAVAAVYSCRRTVPEPTARMGLDWLTGPA
jgi:hypothetical protein